jgi:hypothetical protein
MSDNKKKDSDKRDNPKADSFEWILSPKKDIEMHKSEDERKVNHLGIPIMTTKELAELRNKFNFFKKDKDK